MLTRAAALPRIFSRSSPPLRRAMSSFTLNKDVFNPLLYKRIQDVWFAGISKDPNKEPDMAIVKRWFMGTPEEKLAFDGECRENFGNALETIGPERFPNPNAEPFLQELREMAQKNPAEDGAEAAWAALSLVILLDQMPRNIFRTNEGLVKVYNHYDRISYQLVRALLSPDSPIGRPDLHPQLRFAGYHRMWFYLPLIHSEDLEAHDLHDRIRDVFAEEVEREGYTGLKFLLEKGQESDKQHREVLERFGRYPHRNSALRRESTAEEKKFLDDGGATFGVAQEKSGS